QLNELLGLSLVNRNILNEIEIIKSRMIATRVAEHLMRQRVNPETGTLLSILEVDEEEEPLTLLEVSQRLREDYLSVKPATDEVDLVVITARSTQPEEAVLIANLYADEYVAYNQTSSRARMRASADFLAAQAARFDSLLGRAEQNILQY
ncbi:hypothetical protein HF633_12980, partial [Weissella cibaria]|nr:hypothetical protein [Weissella cibaria]